MTAGATQGVSGHLSLRRDCIRKDAMAMHAENSVSQCITSGYKEIQSDLQRNLKCIYKYTLYNIIYTSIQK